MLPVEIQIDYIWIEPKENPPECGSEDVEGLMD